MKLILKTLLFCLVFLSACQDDKTGNHDRQQDHVWKDQADTLEKAKAVEGILKESAEDQRQQIQDQTK